MGTNTARPSAAPDRTDVSPETYALYVDDEHVHVWQYRYTIAEQDGEWYHEETLERASNIRLSLSYVAPGAPDDDGYWLYSRSFECELDCD